MRTGLTVTYSHGVDPPVAGRLAAAELTDQIIYALTGSEECALPERVTSVTRQGISYDILDPQQFIKEGKTGIYLIDLFLQAANPYGAVKRPKIYSGEPQGRLYR